MSNITFRGIRTDNGQVVEGYYGRDCLGGHVITVYINNFERIAHYNIHPASLAMSTGLCDKNGKQIFGSIEVDGVMSKGGDELMYIATHISSMDVMFKDGCFMGVGPFNTHPLQVYLTAKDFQSIEIIKSQFTHDHKH